MTDSELSSPDGRLDTMLPGMPLSAKIALLAGLAGGLFASIIMSYVDTTRQYQVLAAGLLLGAIVALALTIRQRRRYRET